jgi:ring-1,2-phenylacetyl-CoA epoxidase subunit PaaC
MMEQSALFEYVLRMSDDSLILAQRLGEWCGHGPILEEDIALTNISLDLIGQAISLYDLAANLEGKGRNHDQLAYMRYELEYKNVLLVEQPNGDFAMTMLRQFFFDAFRLPLYEALMQSPVEQLAAIAAKSVKETRYHLKHSSEWVIRMGDGTDESHKRAQDAIDHLWRYTHELFYVDAIDHALLADGKIPNMETIQAKWMTTVTSILQEATLEIPKNNWKFEGGREGRHSEHMGYLLADLQYMQRAYPNMEW